MTDTQRQAADMIVRCESYERITKALHIGHDTLRRWRKREDFQAEVRAAYARFEEELMDSAYGGDYAKLFDADTKRVLLELSRRRVV